MVHRICRMILNVCEITRLRKTTKQVIKSIFNHFIISTLYETTIFTTQWFSYNRLLWRHHLLSSCNALSYFVSVSPHFRCDSEFLCTGEPSILLTGGNTKLMGFVDRIKSELTRAKVDRAVIAPEERIYSTWVGGSILASHSSFSERWISTEDYADHGANIVNRRSSLFWSNLATYEQWRKTQ